MLKQFITNFFIEKKYAFAPFGIRKKRVILQPQTSFRAGGTKNKGKYGKEETLSFDDRQETLRRVRRNCRIL